MKREMIETPADNACVSSDARTRQAAGPESADAATKTRRLAERRAFVDSRLMSSSVRFSEWLGPGLSR
jgi:hypothetical protein